MMSAVFSTTAFAQNIPNGNLIMMLSCNLEDGGTMQEAIEFRRNQPRDATAPGQVYYRVPAIAGNFVEDYDFMVALY